MVGASGSGKSSLVHAGLIPMLRRHGLGDGEPWQVVSLRPSETPLNTLANALIRSLGDAPDPGGSLHQALQHRPGALSDYVAQRPGGERVLVVIDQAEELFALRDAAVRAVTDASDEAAAQAAAPFDGFVRQLIHASRAPAGRVTVLLTVRADRLHRFLEQDVALAEAMKAGQWTLTNLRPDAMRTAIEHPAWRRTRRFEPRLIDELLRAMHAAPGQLPLLQFALDRLWREAGGALLDWNTYDKIGQIAGAIAQHADMVLAQQQTPDKVRLVFEALITLGEGAPDTRRRVPQSRLDAGLLTVAQALAGPEARLLITSTIDGEEQIEVAHEALIGAWTTLKDWVQASRDTIRYERQVEAAAREYAAEGHLWQGAKLLTLHEKMPQMVAERSPSGEMVRFYEASWRARVRRRRRAVVTWGVVSAVVLGLGVMAWVQRGHALREADRAEARLADGLRVADLIGRRVEHELTTSRDVPRLRTLLLADMEGLIEALDPDGEHADAQGMQASKLGIEAETLLEAGKLPEAQAKAEQALAIFRRLAAQNDDVERQRKLAVSWRQVGDIAVARGDLDAAQRAYAAGLEVANALAQRDPANTQWQRDLSASHSRLMELALNRKDYPTARRHAGKSVAIATRLFQQPGGRGEAAKDLMLARMRSMVLEEQASDMGAVMEHLKAARALLAGIDARGEFKGDAQMGGVRRFFAELPPTD